MFDILCPTRIHLKTPTLRLKKGFSNIYFALDYQQHKKTIRLLKERGVKHISKLIYDSIISSPSIEKYINSFDLITSIPCSTTRSMVRGFDQSKEIAKNNPNYRELFKKNLHSKGQKNKIIEARNSVKFQLIDKDINTIEKLKILVFDDITTSGSTLNNAIKTIKSSYPQSIVEGFAVFG